MNFTQAITSGSRWRLALELMSTSSTGRSLDRIKLSMWFAMAHSELIDAVALRVVQRDLPLQHLLARASERTEDASGGKQIPWVPHSVRGQFYFGELWNYAGAGARAVATPA